MRTYDSHMHSRSNFENNENEPPPTKIIRYMVLPRLLHCYSTTYVYVCMYISASFCIHLCNYMYFAPS